MKTLLFTFLTLIFIISTHVLIGQTFEVPDYDFKTKEDYEKYHAQIIAAVDWLEQTPVNEQDMKRKKANAFILQWLTGSPTVNVEIQEYVTDLTKKNPDLLVSFLGGWARYQLQHPEETDKMKLNTEGVKALLHVYQLGSVNKDKQVEKLLKLKQPDELEAWVKTQVQ